MAYSRIKEQFADLRSDRYQLEAYGDVEKNLSIMVNNPPKAYGSTSISTVKTKYGKKIAVLLPFVEDDDNPTYNTKAVMSKYPKIFFMV